MAVMCFSEKPATCLSVRTTQECISPPIHPWMQDAYLNRHTLMHIRTYAYHAAPWHKPALSLSLAPTLPNLFAFYAARASYLHNLNPRQPLVGWTRETASLIGDSFFYPPLTASMPLSALGRPSTRTDHSWTTTLVLEENERERQYTAALSMDLIASSR